MNNKYLCFIFILILFPKNLISQSSKSGENYTYQVREENGDLNNEVDWIK